MITTYLEPSVVEEIAKVGRERAPVEACGILLPTPFKGKRVWEMPNRSMEGNNTFELHGADIVITLDEWDGDFKQVAIWHTHPDGGVGPSRADLQTRLSQVGNLVVTLLDGNKAKATWY